MKQFRWGRFLFILAVVLLLIWGIFGNRAPMLTSNVVSSSPLKTDDRTVKIGAILPLSGDNAVLGEPVLYAIQLAIDEFVTKNEIDVEIIAEDAKCSPRDAATATQRLIDSGVVAIVGELCSSATLAAAPIAENAKVLLISPASTNPQLTQAGNYIFRTVPSDAIQGVKGAALADELGDSAAILHVNNDYGLGLQQVFDSHYTGKIHTIETYEQGSSDFRTELTKIKAAGPDILYIIALPVEGGQILKQAKELGLRMQMIASEGLKDQTMLDIADDGAEGLWITFPQPNTDEKFQEFSLKYKNVYREEPNIFTAEAYDATTMILESLMLTDGSPEAMQNHIGSLRNYRGASGTLSFDDFGDVQKPYTTARVINGEFIEQ